MMTSARTITYLGLALMLGALAPACTRPGTEAARDAAANDSARTVPAPPGAGAAQPEASRPVTFRGEMDDRLRVEMSLTREGEQLSGAYSYANVGKEIALRGRVDAGGEFTLSEFDAAGRQTALFKGRWATNDTGDAELKGQWSRPDGSRALQFTLTEVPVELSGGVARVVSKRIRREDKQKSYSIEAEYPQIEGPGGPAFDGFNRAARAVAEREVAEFEGEAADWDEMPDTKTGSDISVRYRVGLVNRQVASVLYNVSTYFAGAAHPNHHTRVVNYDVAAGRELKLADLFRPDALYLRAISDHCVADLKRQFREGDWEDPQDFDAGIEEGASANADNYQSWLITRGGLEITFDPYQVAAYAAGPQRCVVPYAKLKEMLDPQGPAAAFVR